MPWLTPDAVPPLQAYSVYLPDNETTRAAFLGAFLELARVENWEAYGTATPEEIALVFWQAYQETEKLWHCTKEKPP